MLIIFALKRLVGMAKRRPGRPTKYKPEYVQQLLDFFGRESGEWVEVENKKGDMQFVRKAADLPLYESFARSIGVSWVTLRSWALALDGDGGTLYPEFREAYDSAKGDQLRILIENGLCGGYQQSFAIFTAKNILGWRDAMSLEHSGTDGGPIQTITSSMTPQEAAEAYADTLRQ